MTIPDSLSTCVRAVNQITPYRGSGDAGLSTATADRPSSRPCCQRSYWGWKIENVSLPLVSSRGHGSLDGALAADASFSEGPGVAVVHAARPGNNRSTLRTAAGSLRPGLFQDLVIVVSLYLPVSSSSTCVMTTGRAAAPPRGV